MTNTSPDNILCYKFLNDYNLRSEAWVRAQAYKLRHHKNCNFDFFYIDYDPKKLVTKAKWREEDHDGAEHSEEDDKRERESEEEGDEHELEGTEKDKAEHKQARKTGKDIPKTKYKEEWENFGKDKNGKDCGCAGCCDEAKRKDAINKQRAKRGDPDDEDDVEPITHKRPEPTAPTGKGPSPPKPSDPKPPPKEPTVDPTPPPPKPPTEPPKPPGKGEWIKDWGFYNMRDFYIISSLGDGRYLDVVDQKNVVIKTPNEYDSQKWWFDWKTKTVKNRLYKHKSLDISGGGATEDMQIWNTNGHWFQLFKYQQNYIFNVRDQRCLTVSQSTDQEGQDVVLQKKIFQLSQKWNIVYVDQAEDNKTSGIYKPYEIQLSKPFIIRSRMPMQRVISIVSGRNAVIKTHNRSDQSQIFFLDPGTKTIKSA